MHLYTALALIFKTRWSDHELLSRFIKLRSTLVDHYYFPLTGTDDFDHINVILNEYQAGKNSQLNEDLEIDSQESPTRNAHYKLSADFLNDNGIKYRNAAKTIAGLIGTLREQYHVPEKHVDVITKVADKLLSEMKSIRNEN